MSDLLIRPIAGSTHCPRTQARHRATGENMTKRLVGLMAIASLLFLSSCNRQAAPTPIPRPTSTIPWSTINAYDADLLIDPVNLWAKADTPSSVVGKIHHGDRVRVLARKGDRVQVETRSGVRGWCHYMFIDELR